MFHRNSYLYTDLYSSHDLQQTKIIINEKSSLLVRRMDFNFFNRDFLTNYIVSFGIVIVTDAPVVAGMVEMRPNHCVNFVLIFALRWL